MTHEQEQEQIIRDFKNVFASDAGKRVFMHIMKAGFVYDECFVIGSQDNTAYNLGRRSIGLLIKDKVEFDFTDRKDRKTVTEVADVQN